MASISVEHVDEQGTDSHTPAKIQRNSKRFNVQKKTVLALIFFAILLGATGYLFVDRAKLSNKLSDAQSQSLQAPEDESKRLADEVSRLIELPADEIPTIATVTDISKVKDKPFFAKAQNGDKVLLYAKAGKAVLYRPSTKKLIEISALNLSDAQPTNEAKTTTSTNR